MSAKLTRRERFCLILRAMVSASVSELQGGSSGTLEAIGNGGIEIEERLIEQIRVCRVCSLDLSTEQCCMRQSL